MTTDSRIYLAVKDLNGCSQTAADIIPLQMNCYKRSMLEDDGSSLSSLHVSEGISTTTTHIRYHPGFRFWNRRSLLEKCLIIITASLFCLLVILFFTRPKNPLNGEYCLTETCIRTAANILSSIDQGVDPCDNFYEFACGRWIRFNPVPNGKPVWNAFNQLEYKNEAIIRSALEKKSAACEAEKKAKWYYTSCVDKNATIEQLGARPALEFLQQIHGWHLLDGRNFSIADWDFQKTIHILHNRYNMGSLFSWYVGEDDKNSSNYVITVDQPTLSLPTRQHYLKNDTANAKILDAYLRYMITIGELLGADKNQTEKQMSDVIKFECSLAMIMTPDEDRRDEEKVYMKITIAELDKVSPFMSWSDYFGDAFSRINRSVTNEEPVVTYGYKYLTALYPIMKEKLANEEDKLVVHNYVIWQAVRRLVPYLSKPFRSALKTFRNVLYGSEDIEEPWRTCIADTNAAFGMAIGALYVREVFPGNSKLMASEMVNNVREAFTENFRTLNWMDEQTSKLAEEKAIAVTHLIGFPDFILNGSDLDAYYKEEFVKPDDYFGNNLRINEVAVEQNLIKLGPWSSGRARWSMSPSIVNAFYTTSKNQIVFPAGILQPPFFDRYQLQSLNYGSIGVVMGHELTHGFDDQGREFDKNGNMHKWWNNKTIERFKTHSQCFVDQYSKYKINGKQVNGLQTLGENIADNGGLKAAYRAYLKLLQNSDQLLLPGLDYSQQQLFFISFAQLWCSDSTNESVDLMIDKDTHSPSPFRVLGPVSNMHEFSHAFQCPLGSTMNPKLKCELW